MMLVIKNFALSFRIDVRDASEPSSNLHNIYLEIFQQETPKFYLETLYMRIIF